MVGFSNAPNIHNIRDVSVEILKKKLIVRNHIYDMKYHNIYETIFLSVETWNSIEYIY